MGWRDLLRLMAVVGVLTVATGFVLSVPPLADRLLNNDRGSDSVPLVLVAGVALIIWSAAARGLAEALDPELDEYSRDS